MLEENERHGDKRRDIVNSKEDEEKKSIVIKNIGLNKSLMKWKSKRRHVFKIEK